MIILSGDGTYATEAVGESEYQDELSQIVGGKQERSVEHFCTAILVPEPRNPYDSNAIVVTIDGLQVGYLSRPLAKVWSERLARIGKPTGLTQVPAVIVGGWKRQKRGKTDEGHFGVKLDFA